MDTPASPRQAIGYLVNQYPKVSHTFIRREIAALERLGFQISRFSLRRSGERFADSEDRAEAARTRVVLDAGAARTLLAVAAALRRPRRFLQGFRTAVEMGWRSDAGLLRQVAYLAEACVLVRWLHAAGVEHLHVHHGTNSAAVAMLACHLGGPRYSLTVHGPEEFARSEPLSLQRKIDAAEFVVGVCEHGAELLRGLSRRPHAVRVVRCGLDDRFLNAPSRPPPQEARLVCVGRLCPQKNQPLLIRASALLARNGVRFELTLVGDGPLRSVLARQIREAGLTGRVKLIGWASGDRVREELLAARALVLPSSAEGLPVAIMEAFALQRPVIATAVGGVPELVEPARSGWLVPPASEAALAAALHQALKATPEQLWKMGRVGRRAVLARHDASREATTLAGLLTGVRSDPASRPRAALARTPDRRR